MLKHLVVETFELAHPVHGPVPCRALLPSAPGPHPACLFLFGGGGSPDTLADLAEPLEQAVDQGRVAPMTIACAGVPPLCFYLDDPEQDWHWETVVAEDLLQAVRSRFAVDQRAGLVGVSMGGYGALKMAFARPAQFGAVAAVAPMLEPSLEADGAPLRNRFHYPPGVPQGLLGPQRRPALFASDHPAARARRHADGLRSHGPAIWLDVGSRDACHAHDGTELLHRVLWDLDIPHEYHLLRDADHVGPTLAPRLLSAFAWVGQHLAAPPATPSADEQALHAALSNARAQALARDDSVARTYGRLPN